MNLRKIHYLSKQSKSCEDQDRKALSPFERFKIAAQEAAQIEKAPAKGRGQAQVGSLEDLKHNESASFAKGWLKKVEEPASTSFHTLTFSHPSHADAGQAKEVDEQSTKPTKGT